MTHKLWDTSDLGCLFCLAGVFDCLAGICARDNSGGLVVPPIEVF